MVMKFLTEAMCDAKFSISCGVKVTASGHCRGPSLSPRDEARGRDSANGDQALAACQALCAHGLMYPVYCFPKVGVTSPNLQAIPNRTIVTIIWCQTLNSGPVTSEEAGLLRHGEGDRCEKDCVRNHFKELMFSLYLLLNFNRPLSK